MRKVFEQKKPFRVPDGTLVSPFLNAKDSESGLPFDLLDEFSVASGIIGPLVESKIQVLPFVTQVTYVLEGELTAIMREPGENSTYEVSCQVDQAIITKPGTFLQLINRSYSTLCRVLYIISPAYVFEKDANDEVIFDDSIALDEDWETLAKQGWIPSKQWPTWQERQNSLERLADKLPAA